MRRKRELKAMLFKMLVGKKSGNTYSGKPTADVKKKRIFLTFMEVRVFLNYGKLHMNFPTNSPV